MRFVCYSDTHERHRMLQYPEGDVLIIAGDFSDAGNPETFRDLNEFLGELSYHHILIVTGNHDVLFEVIEDKMIRDIVTNATFLDNSGITIDGINIYGTSWNLKLWKQMAMKNGKKFKTDIIPENTDILITHEPPFGYLDTRNKESSHLGSKILLDAIHRIKPRYHIFGHIHQAYGRIDTELDDGHEISFLNCAATLDYGGTLREPHIFDFTKSSDKCK